MGKSIYCFIIVTIQLTQNNLDSHIYKTRWANFYELILFNCWLLITFFHFLPVSDQTALFSQAHENELAYLPFPFKKEVYTDSDGQIDQVEPYLDRFDEAGLKVILSIQPNG